MIAPHPSNGTFITVSLTGFFSVYLAICIVLLSVQLPTETRSKFKPGRLKYREDCVAIGNQQMQCVFNPYGT